MRAASRLPFTFFLALVLMGMDTDGDGTSDERELELGTDPAHNGQLDFPEPMLFDMVRGLGATQGELEVNTLVQLPSDPFEVIWAPEIEVAIIDGFAIELEVGFVDADFVGIKLGLQSTLAMAEDASVAHGLLALAEHLPDDEVIEASLSYILGLRLAPNWSVVSIMGPALESHLGVETIGGGLLNATLFWAPRPRWVFGSEQNLALFPNEHLFRWMPQAHYQIDRRFQLQIGAGYLLINRRSSFEAALRIIVEL